MLALASMSLLVLPLPAIAEDCSGDELPPEQRRLLANAPQEAQLLDPAEFFGEATPTEGEGEAGPTYTGIRLALGDKVLRAESGQLLPRGDGSFDWTLQDAVLLLPPYLFRVDQLRVNEQSGEVQGTDIRFWRGNVLSGSGRSLTTRLQTDSPSELLGPIAVDSFSLSLCSDIDAPGWGLQGSSLTLDPFAALAEARGLSLRFLGVPLPGPPLARFPLDGRSVSGFLVPVFNIRNEGEVDIALPYLQSLGRSADLTIAPRTVQDIGTGLESQLRYVGNINSGALSLASLNTEDRGELQAVYWRHALQAGDDFHFNVEYTEADRTFTSLYPPATVNIPSLGGLNRQRFNASWRLSPLLMSLRSERYERPFGGAFGEYRKDWELEASTQRRYALWGWQLSLENGRFGGGRLRADLPDRPDRPLDDAGTVMRTHALAGIAAYPETSWGWARLRLQAEQTSQAIAGYRDGRQSSISAEVTGGLRLVNASGGASGNFYLQPSVSHRQVDFSASRQPLQNLDSSIYPASATRPLGSSTAGRDFLPARDHSGLKLDLGWRWPGELSLRATAQVSRWGAAAEGSLLRAAVPQLSEGETTRALALTLSRGRHSLAASGSSGERLYDNSRRIAWRWNARPLNFSLGHFRRDQGGGRNSRLEYEYLRFGIQFTSTWRITGYLNNDAQNDRNVSRGFSVSYDSCCIAFRVSAGDYLYTDYDRVTSDDWLAWDSLPVNRRDVFSFSLQLKAGFLSGSTNPFRLTDRDLD